MEIIIAGIIRWNIVTKSPQISCNELSEREKVVFGNLRHFAVGCQIVLLADYCHRTLSEVLWWTVKNANGSSLMG